VQGPPAVAGVTGTVSTPISETTNFYEWDTTHVTWADFTMTLNPFGSGVPSVYSGASTQEFNGATGSDGCYNSYVANNPSGPASKYAPFITVTAGTPWTVNSFGLAGYDSLGFGPNAIAFFRNPSTGGSTWTTANPATLPCETTVYQIMEIKGTDSNWYSYGATNSGNQNTLHDNIASTSTLTSERSGVNSTIQNQ